MSLQGKALSQATWCSEALCMTLTLSYTFIVLHDLASSPASRYTNESWFKDGFCVAWEGSLFNSHCLCFAGDVLCGSALAGFNWVQFRDTRDSRFLPALAVGVFDALHGMGHLMIALIGLDVVGGTEHRSVGLWLLQFSVMLAFLSIGPYVAHQVNGVGVLMCTILHLISVALYVEFVPVQFAFGAVNLFLNSWYCVPRIAFVGCETQWDIETRTKDGWDVVSIGLLLVMIIVYAECLCCDAFFRALSGHFLYDASILILSAPTPTHCGLVHLTRARGQGEWHTPAWSRQGRGNGQRHTVTC